MSAPWMPLYIGDYLKDTRRLSTLEHGAYLLLIMEYWQQGCLPTDDPTLARITGLSSSEWKSVRKALVPYFGEDWKHPRIEAELARADEKSAKARNSALGHRWKNQQADPVAGKEKRSVRLSTARDKGSHKPEEWFRLLEFCGRKCVRCGSVGFVVKDHIHPIYAGGSDAINNLQPLCRKCNSSKGPEKIDFRPDGWEQFVCSETSANGGVEGLHSQALNACETPAKRLLSQSQSETSLTSQGENNLGSGSVIPFRVTDGGLR